MAPQKPHASLLILCMMLILKSQDMLIQGQSSIIVTPIVEIINISPDSNSDRVAKVTSTLTRIDAIMGENVIFECSAIDLQADRPILWKKTTNGTSSITLNDGLRSLDSSKYRVSQGSSTSTSIRLELMSVSYASAGTYMCEVFYDDRSSEIRHSRRVDVYEQPRFSVRDTSNEISANIGEDVSLLCGASGWPTPLLYWHRSAGSSSVIRNHGRQVEGTTIRLSQVQASDRGTYICNAVNRIGSSQWPVRLSVNFPPSVSFENGDTASQRAGCTLELLCVIEANPVPASDAVSVTKDGESLVSGKDGVNIVYMQGADSTLYVSVYIYPFANYHSGTYTCSARNNIGRGDGQATIRVTSSATAVPGRSGSAICSACCRLASSLLLALTAAAAAMGLRFAVL